MANAADAHAHDDHGDHYPGFFLALVLLHQPQRHRNSLYVRVDVRGFGRGRYVLVHAP